MISDPVLRWTVTALFVLSAAEVIFALVTSHRARTHVVSHLLHLLMAVAMAVMAWPRGATLPAVAPMVFFVAATAWFVGTVVAGPGHRLVNGYHALMMLAMAWMYAVMNGHLLPGELASMSGMDVSGAPPFSTEPVYVDAGNWACVVGFAVAALWWVRRYVVRRAAEPAQPAHRLLGDVCQAMMAAGTSLMFGVIA